MSFNIDSIKKRMLVKYPFFGSIIANLNYVESRDCYSNGQPTAGTDGNTIYYHPDFINSLTKNEQVFIFAHEVCHVAFDHIFRSEGKDPDLWNTATDAVINAYLEHDGLQIVKDGVNMPEAFNYDAEAFYQKLLEQKQNAQKSSENGNQNMESQSDSSNAQNSGSSSQGQENDQKDQSSPSSNNQNNGSESGQQKSDQSASDSSNAQNSDSNSQGQENDQKDQSSSGNHNQNSGSESEQQKSNSEEKSSSEQQKDVGHDTHDMWQKAVAKRKQEETKKQNEDSQRDSSNDHRESEQKSHPKPDSLDEKEKKDIEKVRQQINRLSQIGEKRIFEQNKIDRKKQLDELRSSLAKQSIGAGKDTNSEIRNMNDIGTADPLIDWRRLLKEAIKYDVDWSYRNASIEDGVITPYLEELPKPETEILLDTSGSIDESLLRNFLRECKNILQNSKVKAGCFDTKFYGFNEIKNVNDIDNMPFVGGGGTDFETAVNAFTRRVENKIIFTDGYADMPSKRLDAIWVVFGGKEINPNGGKVIQISDEQLEKLYYQTVNTSFKK